MATYDFTTMYTMLRFDAIVKNTMGAVQEAQEYEASKALPGQGEPKLSGEGWNWDDEGWSLTRFEAMLRILVNAAYAMNGGLVRRQIKGLPMGLACAPRLATLSCYPIEKKSVLETNPTGLITRYIDDFWTCDVAPPPASAYGMEYKKTSENPKQVVHLEIKVDVREGRVHTTMFDREEQCPMHIVRYPHWDTVAPRPGSSLAAC